MSKVEDTIKEFFTYLPKFIAEWNIKVEESLPLLKALKNQCEQIQQVSKDNWNEKLVEKFPDIKDRLISKIRSGIEEEERKLQTIIESLQELNRKLNKKSDLVDRCIYKQNFKDLISKKLVCIYQYIEFCEDVTRYYSTLYLQMSFSFSTCDYYDNKSIYLLKTSLEKSSYKYPHIEDILSHTSFLIE